jgi:signal transduction histidine kinase
VRQWRSTEPHARGEGSYPGRDYEAALAILHASRTGADPLLADDDASSASSAPPASSARPTTAESGADSSRRVMSAESLMRALAGDLHDGALQELFAAGLDLLELAEADPRFTDSVQPVLDRLATRLDDASSQLRAALTDMARGRRPAEDSADLDRAVEELIERFSWSSEVTVDMDVTGRGPEPVGEPREAVLRLVREGLANVNKHALASQVNVTLRRGATWLRVDVDDDGLGDPRAIRIALSHSKDSYGLSSLSDQAVACQGRLAVARAPRLGGVRLSLSVPVGRMSLPPSRGADHPSSGVVGSPPIRSLWSPTNQRRR